MSKQQWGKNVLPCGRNGKESFRDDPEKYGEMLGNEIFESVKPQLIKISKSIERV